MPEEQLSSCSETSVRLVALNDVKINSIINNIYTLTILFGEMQIKTSYRKQLNPTIWAILYLTIQGQPDLSSRKLSILKL